MLVGEYRDFSAGDISVLRIVLNRTLVPGIDNALSGSKHRKRGQRGLPVVACLQFHDADRLAVREQLHTQGIRAESVVVFRVIPDLFHRHVLYSRHMRIGQHRRQSVGRRLHFVISSDWVLMPGIDNRHAMLIDMEIFRRGCPLVCFAQVDRLHRLTVCHEIDRQGLRTQTVLVVPVIPDFHNGPGCRGRGMAVGKCGCMAVNSAFSGIARHVGFLPRVVDRPAVFIQGHFYRGRPSAALCQFFCPVFMFIGDEGDTERIRTSAVPVSVILPDFDHGQGHSCRHMRVGQRSDSAFRLRGQRCVSFHVFLAPGIHNPLACGKHRHILHGCGPVIGPVQTDSSRFFSIGHKCDRQNARAEPVTIIVVIPDFPDTQGRCFRGVTVGQSRDMVLLFRACQRVSGDAVFCPLIRNLLSVRIDREILNGVTPGLRFSERNGPNLCSVALQGDSDSRRTDAVLVSVVIPDFAHRQRGCFRRMMVDERCAGAFQDRLFQRISGNAGLCPLIVDRLSAVIHGQVSNGSCPVFFRLQCQRSDLCPVGCQSDMDFRRTDAVLIVCVIPFLDHGKIGDGNLMAVGDLGGCSCDFLTRRISGDGFLSPGVGDRLTVFIHQQTFHGGSPQVFIIQGHFCPVGQCDLQVGGTQSIPVPVIVPDLCDRRHRLIGFMTVGENGFTACCDRALQGVARYIGFCPGIGNALACTELRQVFNPCRPVIVLIERHALSVAERHLEASRTQTVPVAVIIPDLGNRQFYGRRDMCVFKRCHRAFCDTGQLIALNLLFFPAVNDRLAVFIDIQVINGVRPFIRFTERDGSCRCIVCIQRHCDCLGTDAVLIVCIQPDLLNTQRYCLRHVRIGQCGFIVLRFIPGQRIPFDLAFCPGILNRLTVFIDIETCNRGLPVIFFIECNGNAVIQRHGQFFRTLSIPVLIICPHFPDHDRFCGRHVRVDQSCDIALCDIACQVISGDRFFRPGIDDFSCIVILRQGDNRFPAVAFCQHGLGSVACLHLQGCRTNAILILPVFPDLLHSDILHHDVLCHFTDDNQTAVCVYVGTGGEGNQFDCILCRLLIEVDDIRPDTDAAFPTGAQEIEHGILAVADIVDLMFIGVGCDDGEVLDIIDFVSCHHHAGFITGHVVQSSEHGAVIHVVAVDDVIGIRKVCTVSSSQIDGTGQGRLIVNVMIRVIIVIRALYNRVIDVRIIDGQPCPVVFIDLRQRIRIQGRSVVLQDFRLILQKVPRIGGRCAFGGKGVIEHVTGIKNQDSSKKAGQQCHCPAAGAERQFDDVVHQCFLRGRMGLWVFQIIMVCHAAPPFLPVSSSAPRNASSAFSARRPDSQIISSCNGNHGAEHFVQTHSSEEAAVCAAVPVVRKYKVLTIPERQGISDKAFIQRGWIKNIGLHLRVSVYDQMTGVSDFHGIPRACHHAADKECLGRIRRIPKSQPVQ